MGGSDGADASGPVFDRLALEKAGIPVYENDVAKLIKDGKDFWLAGLGDQIALLPKRQGVDDLPLTLSNVTDDAPIILLAHEPDIFPKVSDRVSLTLSGYTHGGQIRILNYSPLVPPATATVMPMVISLRPSLVFQRY